MYEYYFVTFSVKVCIYYDNTLIYIIPANRFEERGVPQIFGTSWCYGCIDQSPG